MVAVRRKSLNIDPSEAARAKNDRAQLAAVLASEQRVEAQPAPQPTDPLELGAPMPKSYGRCADLFKEVQALRLAMDKEVAAVKAREAEIKEYLIANLSKSDDTGAAGLKYRAQIVMKDVPRATDWHKLWDYIAENNRFDLLQKRLGEKAVMDMLEQGEKLPGVEVVHVPDVSITKI